MTDIDTIRREIDGLHAKATHGKWVAIHDESDPQGPYSSVALQDQAVFITTADRESGVDLSPDDANLIASLQANWPAISAALAEAETLRRKAEAFDKIACGEVSAERKPRLGPGFELEWACVHRDGVRLHRSHDLLTAIDAALAAKETPDG